MVDPLPVNYRKAPLAIATYSFSEIVDGTGIVTFLGSRISVDATAANDEYILITDTINPSVSNTTMANGGDGLDFDVQFAATKTIDGFAYFSLPINANDKHTTPSVEVIHYDGSTETTIVAETSMPPVLASANRYEDRILKVEIPRTKFAIGDILRLTIRTVLAGGAGQTALFHDPTGSIANFTRSGGILKAYIPFEVEI